VCSRAQDRGYLLEELRRHRNRRHCPREPLVFCNTVRNLMLFVVRHVYFSQWKNGLHFAGSGFANDRIQGQVLHGQSIRSLHLKYFRSRLNHSQITPVQPLIRHSGSRGIHTSKPWCLLSGSMSSTRGLEVRLMTPSIRRTGWHCMKDDLPKYGGGELPGQKEYSVWPKLASPSCFPRLPASRKPDL
jgi:hypothetical protein